MYMVSGLDEGSAIFGRGKSNIVSVDNYFALESSSHVSLEPTWSQRDINSHSREVMVLTVQTAVLDDTP